MKFFNKLFGLNTSSAPSNDDWRQTDLIYVVLPEPLDPMDRSERYENPIEAELKLSNLGYVSGGGSSLSDVRPDGSRKIEWCGIDVDTVDIDKCRALLHQHLPELGCLAGTQLQFRMGDMALLDEFDGDTWHVNLPRTNIHPGFRV